jgi:catechol 2,3-dioxygenase-like lactoylglutathione lyase family enzyme
MSRLFNHVDVVVSSLERSLPFYRELLRRLGWEGEGPIRGERGEVVIYLESGPGEYDYSPGYYAVFFYDPDSIKLEIVHKPVRPAS